jgi:hypothetical protein
MAFFVGGEDVNEATWRHEATHQLFSERPRSSAVVGAEHNFWLVEGIALYMESLQRCGPWLTVGGIEADRLQYARYRALREEFCLPLEQLAALDQAALQAHPEIQRLYSQAAGTTHFLMHGQNGRHATALRGLLQQLYLRNDSANSLPKLTGSSWEELDAAYREFLQVRDEQLELLDPRITIRNLALGKTSVTDIGMQRLPSLERLEWLDLSGTTVSDAGTHGLAATGGLRQASFEHTAVGDETVARLTASRQTLEQLDLAHTQITDAALASIAQLPRLEQLWLTGTEITDGAAEHLRRLPRLRVLDLSGTKLGKDARLALERSIAPDSRANAE